ncbi:hypothetical protein [Spongiactinospora sp. TRM90649]|uniref:hypothetical protein n=1 Tax=Spongiactinospora sp. TRM90649 TaxID=3031114 RepID=UPI0023F7581D|nr:hypothetical protein [Spongiactinospora sp. TRM90649]MDF5757729.1 hypothetical protein [Spongiactinospora sp. TRM90649]
MNTPAAPRPGPGDAEAAAHALRAAGLVLSVDEIARIATGYAVLRAKAAALHTLDLRDDPPFDPTADGEDLR